MGLSGCADGFLEAFLTFIVALPLADVWQVCPNCHPSQHCTGQSNMQLKDCPEAQRQVHPYWSSTLIFRHQ